jgi:phospholipid-transporting ATPase
MANFYFLMLTLLELIKPISDSGGVPTMAMPLVFVVGVSMIKDIFEDRKRHKSDNEENLRQTQAIIRGQSELKQMRSQDIKVGCIVKVRENEFFPCDMLLLGSSIPKGICYVETKNLDGETNLKHKQAHKNFLKIARSENEIIKNFNGCLIECEQPNEYLYKFNGNITTKQGDVLPLDAEMVLLRGSSLRNTAWVYGVAVFTGHETKIMKNSTRAKAKKSTIEKSTNNYIIVTIFIQSLLCLFAGAYGAVWNNYFGVRNMPYLELNPEGKLWVSIPVGFGTWFLALMNFVAISMMVTLEMVKFFQAYFIQEDYMMFDQEKGIQAAV